MHLRNAKIANRKLQHMDFTKQAGSRMAALQAASEVAQLQFNMAALNPNGTHTVGANVLATDPLAMLNLIEAAHCFKIIWDSGASLSISHDLADFVDGIQPLDRPIKLEGIAAGLEVKGKGTVRWCVLDVKGRIRVLELPALYIPLGKQRLLSITSLTKVYQGENVMFNSARGMLTGIRNNPSRQPVSVLIDPLTDLPIGTAFNQAALNPAVVQANNIIATVHRANTNLTEAEKTLLRWHYRLGHLDQRRVQFILRTGMLATTAAQRSLHTAAAKLAECPKCAACQYGKQCRRPVKRKKASAVREPQGTTTKDVHLPGQRVAVDHFVCSTRGRLFTSKGKEAEKDRYMGGCVFVDLDTGFTHIEFQTNLTSHETLLAKDKFERLCREHGVIVQEYVSDLGSAFTSQAFAQHLEKFEQVIRFAGAGGHHHNPQAERAIRTVTCISRTMLFHQAVHWPSVSDPVLWPFAMKQAEYLVNRVTQCL